MKIIKEIFDEFANNQEVDVAHLFKVQRAKIHQCFLYVTSLIKKYPKQAEGLKHVLGCSLCNPISAPWTDVDYLKTKLGTAPNNIVKDVVTPEEYKKFEDMYSQIIKAKRAYESLGGDYSRK